MGCFYCSCGGNPSKMEIGFHQLDKPPAVGCDTPTRLIYSGLPPFDEVTVFAPRGKKPGRRSSSVTSGGGWGKWQQGQRWGTVAGAFVSPPPAPNPHFGCTQSLTAAVRSGHLSPKLTVFLPPSKSSWPQSNPTSALWWWTAQTFAGRVWSALIVHLSPSPRTLHWHPQGSHTFSFLLLKA